MRERERQSQIKTKTERAREREGEEKGRWQREDTHTRDSLAFYAVKESLPSGRPPLASVFRSERSVFNDSWRTKTRKPSAGGPYSGADASVLIHSSLQMEAEFCRGTDGVSRDVKMYVYVCNRQKISSVKDKKILMAAEETEGGIAQITVSTSMGTTSAYCTPRGRCWRAEEGRK